MSFRQGFIGLITIAWIAASGCNRQDPVIGEWAAASGGPIPGTRLAVHEDGQFEVEGQTMN